MPCRPNPPPESAKVWLPTCQLTFYYIILRFIHGLFFSTVVFFPFYSRLLLAYPQLHSPPYYTKYTTILFVFCFDFSIPLRMQRINTYLRICLCLKPRPTKPTFFNDIVYMFQIHVAPRPFLYFVPRRMGETKG